MLISELFDKYPELESDIDRVNDSIREGRLDEFEVTLFNDIVSTLDNLQPLNNIRLYRGLSEFDDKYLSDPGITFKTSSLEVALSYAEEALLVIDYPGNTKQLYSDRQGLDEYISYPGEVLKLTRICPYDDKIKIYYTVFDRIELNYRELYQPEKKAKIKQMQMALAKKLRSGETVKITLRNPSEEIIVAPNHPYANIGSNIIWMKNLISEKVYSNRLI